MVVAWDNDDSLDRLGKERKSCKFCSAAFVAQAGRQLQESSSQQVGAEHPCPDPSFIHLILCLFIWERLGQHQHFLQCCKIHGSGIRIWSSLIYSESILLHCVRNSKLNLWSCSLSLVLRCWTMGHTVILSSCENLPQDWTYKGCAGFPLFHCSFQLIQVKSPRQDGFASPLPCRKQHEDLQAKQRAQLSVLRFDPSRKHRVN